MFGVSNLFSLNQCKYNAFLLVIKYTQSFYFPTCNPPTLLLDFRVNVLVHGLTLLVMDPASLPSHPVPSVLLAPSEFSSRFPRCRKALCPGELTVHLWSHELKLLLS